MAIDLSPPPDYQKVPKQPDADALESQPSQVPYTDVPGRPAWVFPAGIVPYAQPPRRSAKARFCKALGVAFVVYLLCVGTYHLIFGVHSFHGGLFHGHEAARPRPSDGEVHNCLTAASAWEHDERWPTSPRNAHYTFQIPVADAEALYVFSRGSKQYGWVKVIPSDSFVDYAEVTVQASYRDDSLLDNSSVCYLERTKGERGLGIMTPDGWFHHPHESVRFDVTVVLPVGDVKKFETHMSNYALTIEDLGNSTAFDELSLRTSNSGIDVKSVKANQASFRSSNGPIDGTFYARRKLVLHTSNAAIRVQANLINDDDDFITEFQARTSNGPIHGELNLARSDDELGTGGSFDVDAHTSNHDLNLNFHSSPVDSSLDVKARTSNGPASVTLHSAFEGKYHADTSNARAELVRTEVEDPSGNGRSRVIDESLAQGTFRRNAIEGVIFWDDEDNSDKADKGSVKLSSSNKPVTLII
ncbi:hypothetical protein CONPUDRAFT_123715 [Coniophora puteana RWD-64-598 SS2]|uniref:Uncharacterized protein n=1 Tax=Coniophora puteana (strain RWD-64-598) TaxID=741705 RepID=A0A5M3MP28_CONPW|nr:uncharacterized protein CONPUDRAFT_123715 [Coniophora puteana RWD-64-598 SS2]EIW80932.1 hypothetical protein CONPUDRAFT_123715 [Coniophora puteana RWD-64-598 SS2]